VRLRSPLDREILRLALPALGALVAEPLFLLTDTALVGHLGSVPLAGLGVASVILQTALGLLIFLAYATTPTVARRLGAGDRRGAIRAGVDGLWFALVVGVAIAVAGAFVAEPLVGLFGVDADVARAATTYLSVSLIGLPGMLVVIAATGLLRDDGAALRPGLAGVGRTARSGAWLLVRNAGLRAALVATVAAAASSGVAGLAVIQIALTLFSTLAFALDALAIAGQAMVGHALGQGDRERVRAITRRLMLFGVGGGVLLGALLAALAPVLAPVFSSDEGVRALLPSVVVAMAVGIPLAGFVFVLDGVLLGAGDARYLAVASVVSVLVYLALLLPVEAQVGPGTAGAVALWLTFGLGYVGARAVTLGLRARTDRWMVVGAR
jgi:Na+-driven multidrug efflux pump